MKMNSILILGRQPALGFAELEALYGQSSITPLNNNVAELNVPHHKIDFSRLGGSIKLTQKITTIPKIDIKNYLLNHFTLPSELGNKFSFGISLYGDFLSSKDLNNLSINLKNHWQKVGHKVRYVPNINRQLNSAQIWHNQLLGNKGLELVLVENQDNLLVAITQNEQDIFAYARRDQKRPFRDAKVGMLPPKLAQMIINLASSGSDPARSLVIDPFCGTGVILQEALLMGFGVYGSDIDERMVDYSKQNIDWLAKLKNLQNLNCQIEQQDATKAKWPVKPQIVACETFLGEPYFKLPPRDVLQKNIIKTDSIAKAFLLNIAPQLSSGTRLCLALPAWYEKNHFLHLPTLDHLRDLGYNRLAYKFASKSELIYYRPNQIVGRELVTLVKE